MTGLEKNFDWYSENIIKRLKELSYNVSLVIVINNIETVLPRIKERAEHEGRIVREGYTRSVYEALNSAIPKYSALDCKYADRIFIYDNSEVLKLIFTTYCKGEEKLLNCTYDSGVCSPTMIGGKNKKRQRFNKGTRINNKTKYCQKISGKKGKRKTQKV